LAWRCKIYGSVEVDWKSVDVYYIVASSSNFSLSVIGRGLFDDHLFSSAVEELVKEVKLPNVVLLRACVNLEDGLVAVTYREPHLKLPDRFYITLLVCNVNELLCSYWIGDPPDLLAALIMGEAARRAASRQLADSAEQILAPIAKFILGEEVDAKKLVDAMRGQAEIYTNSRVTIFEELNKLKEALGEEDFQKLRRRLEEVAGRSYLGSGPFMGFTFAYLRTSRDERGSLLPAGTTGAILVVALKPESESQHLLDAVDTGIRPYIYTFKSGEILDIATRTMKEKPFDLAAILYVAKRFDNNIGTITDPAKEDVLRMIETYINAFIESYEKDSVVSKTVRLSDGRKLHIIVPREQDVVDKFENTLLLLSNHEIKATFLYNFIDSGYIENNEGAIKHIVRMDEEDIAKLDDETKITVLKLLFANALLS